MGAQSTGLRLVILSGRAEGVHHHGFLQSNGRVQGPGGGNVAIPCSKLLALAVYGNADLSRDHIAGLIMGMSMARESQHPLPDQSGRSSGFPAHQGPANQAGGHLHLGSISIWRRIHHLDSFRARSLNYRKFRLALFATISCPTSPRMN